jgi:single-stranded DNA-binding protein
MTCNLSQIHIGGKLIAEPEVIRTKKNKLFVRLLVEVELVRQPQPGEFQTETTFVPVACFAREAETAKALHRGNTIFCGCQVYGTAYDLPDGRVKRGLQLIADYLVIPEDSGALQKKASPTLPAHF